MVKAIVRIKLLLLFGQFQLGGSGFRNKFKKCFEGTEKMWNNFVELGLKIASPKISAAVAAKTKNPIAAQVNSGILKSISRGKSSWNTDLYGNGLRLRVMWF